MIQCTIVQMDTKYKRVNIDQLTFFRIMKAAAGRHMTVKEWVDEAIEERLKKDSELSNRGQSDRGNKNRTE